MKIGKMMQKLGLKNNDVVLIKKDSSVGKEMWDNREGVNHQMNKIGLSGIYFIFVDDIYDDIRKLDERALAGAGWVRHERLAKLIAKSLDAKKAESKKDEKEDNEKDLS